MKETIDEIRGQLEGLSAYTLRYIIRKNETDVDLVRLGWKREDLVERAIRVVLNNEQAQKYTADPDCERREYHHLGLWCRHCMGVA